MEYRRVQSDDGEVLAADGNSGGAVTIHNVYNNGTNIYRKVAFVTTYTVLHVRKQMHSCLCVTNLIAT